VVSATAGTSNELTAVLEQCYNGRLSEALVLLDEILMRHIELAEACGCSTEVKETVSGIFQEGPVVLKKLSKDTGNYYRYADHLLGIGERVSSLIFCERAKVLNMEVELVDVTTLIMTDELYGRANPLLEETQRNIDRILKPILRKKRVITQGFIARDLEGNYTTLGREGSDYSVSLLGAMLGVDQISIYKREVDGVYQFDPGVLEDVEVIPELSYEDAINMTYLGAKVLHHKTVFPALEKGIKIWVDSSVSPFKRGTLISQKNGNKLVGLSRRPSQTLLYLKNTGFLDTFSFVEKTAALFSKYRFNVDLLTICKNSAYVVIDDSKGGTLRGSVQKSVFEIIDVQKDLSTFCTYKLIDNLELVSIVGKHDREILKTLLEAINGLEVKYFFASPDRNTFSVLVDPSETLKCLRVLRSFLTK
nr:hypothetical protein [Saprospiraceae bacterium]